MIRVQCPHCRKMLKVPENLVGQSRKCPQCKHAVTVPDSPDSLPPARAVPAAQAAMEAPVPLDDNELARQIRQQRGPEPIDGQRLMGAEYLTGRSSLIAEGCRHLYQQASGLILQLADRARRWFRVRRLRREIAGLQAARQQRLVEAGACALEQGTSGLAIEDEKRRVQGALQQIKQLQDQLNALEGTNAAPSTSRELRQQIAQLSNDRDDAVASIGQKAHQAGALTDGLSSQIAGLEAMLRSCRDRLAFLNPEAGNSTASTRSGFRPNRRMLRAAAVVVATLGACWIGYRGMVWARDFVTARTQVVTSVEHEEKVAGAVGLVVCGEKVVWPTGETTEFPIGTGTAFAISPQGHLLTNKHVVQKTWNLMHAEQTLKWWREENLTERTPAVWVFFAGEEYAAEILHVSDEFDLAVLKIDRDRGPYFRLSTLDEIGRGTVVQALGFPGAGMAPLSEREHRDALARRVERPNKIKTAFSDSDFEFVLTTGAVSRIRRDDAAEQTWIQHNADINPGNSGGPLVTKGALVVGINTLGHTQASGIFFSLTLPQLREEIEEHVPVVDWE